MGICEKLMKCVVAFSSVSLSEGVDGHCYVSHLHALLGCASLF